MEKLFAKIEEKFNKQIEEFEKSPVKTTIKWAIIVYLLKKVWNWTKEQ
jgi:hypothetical protein